MDIIQTIVAGTVGIVVSNIGTIVQFLIPTAIALIGTWYGYRQYKLAKTEHSASSSLELDLFGVSDKEVKDFFILLPFKENRTLIVPLLFHIGNSGNVSAEKVEIFLNISKHLYMSDSVEHILPSFAKARNTKHAVDPIDGTEIVQIFLNCEDIAPEVQLGFMDFMAAYRETYLEFNLQTKTKDNFTINLQYHAFAYFKIKISVTAKNIKPIVKEYKLHFRKMHKECEKAFFYEEAKRRSKVSLRHVREDVRNEMLSIPEMHAMMSAKGMSCEFDADMPKDFAIVWFTTEDAHPPLFEGVDLPEGREVVSVTKEQVRIAHGRSIRSKSKKKKGTFSSSKFTPLANAAGEVIVKALVPRRHW